MECGDAVFLDSNSDAVGSIKTRRVKVVKGDSVSVGVGVGVGASQNKILADVTNLQQQPKQHVNVEHLLKEKEMLMKLLANRDAIIESCKAELQKCQNNFQKLRKQNAELALTNSQMLAELNSSRQKLRELQLELGSKNGVLNAMKLELTQKQHTVKLKHETDVNEVRACQNNQSFQEDDRKNAKRKRVSKPRSSAPAVSKQVKSIEKVDNHRYCLRRQSAELKDEKPVQAEDLVEVVEVKYDISHLQENLVNESGPTSLGSKVHDDAREATESSRPTMTEQVDTKNNIEKKRNSMRRQTNRFSPENPEATEDLFEIKDAKFNVPLLSDNMSEKCCPTSTTTSEQGNNACSFASQETRRSSVGRPLRRTVEKVVSYKEAPLNIKMRRDKSGNFISNSR
ncbi:unnamed protein product [Sphenostylis stenocarpa]|uniref:Shugoshin C-terminal domain-containing protein n=1 Tax=Sphenostylis stenocarpa TaxID=92480 RepID=A0AA87B8Z6_9FABA|nr:unnamed protein product [Sphenostylis stenocarpa]